MKTTESTNGAASPVRAMVARMAALANEAKSADEPLADMAANWLATRYLLAVHEKLDAPATETDELAELRRCATDVARFQRGEQRAARLALGRARLAAVTERDQHRLEAEFWKLTKREDIHKALWPNGKRGLTARVMKMMNEAIHMY